MTSSNLLQKTFLDKQGRITLWQNPNLPLIIWVVTIVLTKLLPDGLFADLASILSFGAIFTWAWLEIFEGVNYFRRFLGAIVMVLAVLSRI